MKCKVTAMSKRQILILNLNISFRTASLNDMEQNVMVGKSTASEVLLVTVVPISIFCTLITEITIRLTKYAKRVRITNFDAEVAMFGGQTPDGM